MTSVTPPVSVPATCLARSWHQKSKQPQVEPPVPRPEEDAPAPVAALGHVMGNVGHDEAGDSWHAGQATSPGKSSKIRIGNRIPYRVSAQKSDSIQFAERRLPGDCAISRKNVYCHGFSSLFFGKTPPLDALRK